MTYEEQQRDGIDSFHLALKTIRRRSLLRGRYLPHDEDEARFLDWEIR